MLFLSVGEGAEEIKKEDADIVKLMEEIRLLRGQVEGISKQLESNQANREIRPTCDDVAKG